MSGTCWGVPLVKKPINRVSISERAHFTLFGVLQSPIELKVYTFLGLMNSEESLYEAGLILLFLVSVYKAPF